MVLTIQIREPAGASPGPEFAGCVACGTTEALCVSERG